MGRRHPLAGAEGELTATEEQIGRLVDQIAGTPSKAVRDRYEAKVVALEARKAELEEEHETAGRDLARAERSAKSFTKWRSGLADLKQALAAGDVETRLRLRAHLREFITKVEVFAVGYKRRYDAATDKRARPPIGKVKDAAAFAQWRAAIPIPDYDDLAEELEENVNDVAKTPAEHRTWRRFIEFVMGRRMSRHGRFVRVHFTTGAVLDLVPLGSIASGDAMGFSGTGSGVVRPDIDQLWRRFTKLCAEHGSVGEGD